MSGIRIEDFAIVTRLWDAQTIPLADNRRRVKHHKDQIFRLLAAANKAEHAIVSVVGVNPFETVPVEFNLVKCGF